MFLSEFEEQVNKSKTLDFGTVFNQSIDLFKKVWVQGLITVLLSIVVIIPFYFIIYIPLLFFGIDPEVINTSEDVNYTFIILVFLFFIVFGILASAVSMALMSAFYKICKQKDFEELASDDYFYYFKKSYFIKMMKLSLIGMGISLLAMILFVLPLFYVMVPLSFLCVIFAFNPEASVSDIIKASFKLGNKKWLITFALMLVCGILAEIVGVIMCFVGLFATVSFAYIPLYIIYKEVIGFQNSEDETVFIETTS